MRDLAINCTVAAKKGSPSSPLLQGACATAGTGGAAAAPETPQSMPTTHMTIKHNLRAATALLRGRPRGRSTPGFIVRPMTAAVALLNTMPVQDWRVCAESSGTAGQGAQRRAHSSARGQVAGWSGAVEAGAATPTTARSCSIVWDQQLSAPAHIHLLLFIPEPGVSCGAVCSGSHGGWLFFCSARANCTCSPYTLLCPQHSQLQTPCLSATSTCDCIEIKSVRAMS